MRHAFLVATLLCFAPVAAAQDHSRPDPAGTPTRVSVGIYVLDLAEINGAKREIVVDFAIRAMWKDPRLTVPGVMDAGTVWTPQLRILNERRLFRKRKEVVEIDAENTVTYTQRYWGTVAAPIQLHDFPLDSHRVGIELVSDEDVLFVPNEELIGRSDEFSIADWSVGEGRLEATTYDFLPGAHGRRGLTYKLEVTRYLGFFIWKILLPLVLIVSMSWAVFWVDPVEHGPQLGITVTSMLTLMAYRLIMEQFVPKLPHLTRLDEFIIGSTLLVFLALAQEVTTLRLLRMRRPDLAFRVDRICRTAFPAAFVAIAVYSFAL